jgi:Fe-S-cluster containining protein
MNAPDFPAIASRLCAECGLCCNGVMFHTVRLQAGDSAKALSALGLRLKRKQGNHYIVQPCPAFTSQCTIYAARPQRCRLFECRQLQRAAAGEISEAVALGKIREAKQRVAELEALLERIGGTNPKRPLSRRCENALAEPVDPSQGDDVVARHRRLREAVAELEALLNADFRLVPTQPRESTDED